MGYIHFYKKFLNSSLKNLKFFVDKETLSTVAEFEPESIDRRSRAVDHTIPIIPYNQQKISFTGVGYILFKKKFFFDCSGIRAQVFRLPVENSQPYHTNDTIKAAENLVCRSSIYTFLQKNVDFKFKEFKIYREIFRLVASPPDIPFFLSNLPTFPDSD